MYRAYFHLRQQQGQGDGGARSSSAPASEAIDNPDQRICDDVGSFCSSSSSIVLALVKKASRSAIGRPGGRASAMGLPYFPILKVDSSCTAILSCDSSPT